MPIFLMHIVCSTADHLMKIGIENAVIHVVLGLGISFAGPIIAAWIMKKNRSGWNSSCIRINLVERYHGMGLKKVRKIWTDEDKNLWCNCWTGVYIGKHCSLKGKTPYHLGGVP